MKTKIQQLTVALVAIFLAVFSSNNSLFAQSGGGGGPVPATLPMIQDHALSRNYALGLGKFGTRSVTANSIVANFPGALTYTNIAGSYGEAVLDQLLDVDFQYGLENANDIISGYLYLYDGPFDPTGINQPNQLFQGYAQYTRGDLLSGNKPVYGLYQATFPLPLYGVSYAEVLVLDTNQMTVGRLPIDVKNGRPFWPPWYSGAPNGILAVTFQNGSFVTYNTENPKGQTPASAMDASSEWKVPGHYTFQNPSKISITEVYYQPSILLVVTNDNGLSVMFDIRGIVQNGPETTFERPMSMSVGGIDGIPNGSGAFLPDQMTPWGFAKGVYRLTFNWKNFQKQGFLYAPQGAGKGL